MAGTTDPMAAVRQYTDAFNRGDVKTMVATCADPMQILDGLAPHAWQGPTAVEDWYRDVMIESEHAGASGYVIKLGEPRHVDTNGDTAYVVVLATMTFEVRGTQVTQTGAVYTVALRKVGNQWRLTAWAWAKGTGTTGAKSQLLAASGRGRFRIMVAHHLARPTMIRGAINRPTAPSSADRRGATLPKQDALPPAAGPPVLRVPSASVHSVHHSSPQSKQEAS